MPDSFVFDSVPGMKRIAYTDLQRGEILERTQWATDFSWKQIQTLAQFMQVYEAEEGSVLFREGDGSTYMCLIVAGEVSVVKGDTHEGLKHLSTLGSGNTFGEMALVDAEPRSASVVTNKKTELLVLSQQDFTSLALETPQLALKLIKKIARMMSARLRKTTGALSEYLERIDK